MSNDIASDAFWLRLIALSDSIDQECVSMEHLNYLLVGIEEGYKGNFDPAINFEEYVAVRLCSSIKNMVETSQID